MGFCRWYEQVQTEAMAAKFFQLAEEISVEAKPNEGYLVLPRTRRTSRRPRLSFCAVKKLQAGNRSYSNPTRVLCTDGIVKRPATNEHEIRQTQDSEEAIVVYGRYVVEEQNESQTRFLK